MESGPLDEYVALNEQLVALVDAGVPIDAGLATGGLSTAATLERIQSTVSRRVGRGETLDEALQGDESEVPSAYRSLVRLGLHSHDTLAAGFDGASRVAGAADRVRYSVESALVYPLVVCVLAYAGMISLCVFFVPALEGMHESLRLTPGPGLRVLQWVRDAMPFWVVLLPLLLAAFAALRMRSRSRQRAQTWRVGPLFGWLPGVSRMMFQEECARFADALSGLLQEGIPLGEALQVAADSSGDPRLRETVGRLATAVAGGELPADDSPTALKFPPFLRWALWHSEGTTGRPHALEIAARVYRTAAERRGQQLRTVAPVVAMVLFGGTITLVYCLAVFVPLVELLQTLAK
jgi:type II secretory pathway component PulF